MAQEGFFPFFALFFIPWAQGRLRILRYFFEEKTQQAIEEASDGLCHIGRVKSRAA